MTKQSIYRSARSGSALLFFSICLLPTVSVAQSWNGDDALQSTIYRKPVDMVAPGIRLGSFELKPGAELGVENNDNIFYFSRDAEQLGLEKVGDNIFHVRPWLNLNSDWSRHELNFHAFLDAARYQDYDSQNYTDWTMSLDGRIDVKTRSAFSYSAGYWKLHQTRGEPEDRNAIDPTKYGNGRYSAAYSHTFNRLTPELTYNYQDYNFDNNVDVLGEVIDNKGRDRSRDSLTLKLSYDYSDQTSIFTSYQANQVNYDLNTDENGYRRSSSGYYVRAGLSWRKTGLLTGNLYGMYLNQDYDDPRLKSVNGFGVGAQLNWIMTQLTNVNLKFENTPQETTLRGVSGAFSQLYEVRVQHELRRNILLNARVSYMDNSYQTNDDAVSRLNSTKNTQTGLSVNYLFNRNFYLSGGYVYSKQNANESFYDYTTNRWFLTVGMEF